MSASYLDLHTEIDNGGRLRTKLYDKRDDFNFPIVNFPFISSNINTTGVTSGAGTAYPSGAPEFIPGF
jgi:hypothetical protein